MLVPPSAFYKLWLLQRLVALFIHSVQISHYEIVYSNKTRGLWNQITTNDVCIHSKSVVVENEAWVFWEGNLFDLNRNDSRQTQNCLHLKETWPRADRKIAFRCTQIKTYSWDNAQRFETAHRAERYGQTQDEREGQGEDENDESLAKAFQQF